MPPFLYIKSFLVIRYRIIGFLSKKLFIRQEKLVTSGKLGASLPLPPLRTVRVPFKTHRLKPPIAGPFAVVSSSHTISVSKTYTDAPNGGIHNSTFLSSEDSHNLMFLRETNEKSAPFRVYHGFVRKDDSIRSVIQFPAFLFSFEITAFAFSRILYPLSHRLTLQSSYCLYR